MEVGAVKLAFNNELIQMKSKFNQARIQIIHKLTRKAKVFAEKKSEKLKRKAELAVREVLILKKLKVKEVARFIITHKGNVKDFLNHPEVNKDKVCARLLLHKSLEDRYNFLRSRYSAVPIDDLLMSREERKKRKKEEKEKQKNKRKAKENKEIVNVEGDWDVEDVDLSKNKVAGEKNGKDLGNSNIENHSSEDDVETDNESQQSDDESAHSDSDSTHSDKEDNLIDHDNALNNAPSDSENYDSKSDSEVEKSLDLDGAPTENTTLKVNSREKSKNKSTISKNKRIIVSNDSNTEILAKKSKDKPVGKTNNLMQIPNKKVATKPKDLNKNKNFKEKIMLRKFNKLTDEAPIKENKIVDPFFITSTGENYMSVAEPRQPDEVKEVHKQGNRQHRRAIMFGHVPKSKPRQNNYDHNNSSFNKDNENRNGYYSNKFSNNSDRGGRHFKSNDMESKPDKIHPSWEAKKKKSGILPFEGKKIVFGYGPDHIKNNDSFNNKHATKRSFDGNAKPEKLHPSWEAKKKQSGILPFQGKKITFEE